MIERVKTAVVTGGGHGIGRALCRRLQQEGVMVVVADIDEGAAQKVASEIGGRSLTIDVRDEDQVQDMVIQVENEISPIDLFVSNAGIAYGDQNGWAASREGLLNPDEDRWDACWQINVMAHVYAARHLVPRMIERGGGFLVNVASAAGLLSQVGDAAYSASKHAAVAFAESLAITHGEQGIHVCLVCPQAVATRMIGVEDDSDNGSGGGFGGNDIDGILRPEVVADCIVEGIQKKNFLILPHPEVAKYMQRKASDRERWIKGMQRFRRSLTS